MNNGWETDVSAFIRREMGAAPERLDRLAGGANNIGVRVELGGKRFFAKVYFRHPGDDRDRLGTEFGMLQFLWDNGVRCIPQPIACERESGIGLYEFVKGAVPCREDVSPRDVAQLADLLVAMCGLRLKPGAEGLPPASEACFSLSDYVKLQDRRMGNLFAAAASHGGDEFAAFVHQRLPRTRTRVAGFVEAAAGEAGTSISEALATDSQTLSPADHGFHNAIRRGEQLVFLDFEYAGWDDPAQMIANACLQPRVPIPEAMRGGFVAGILRQLPHSAAVAKRLRMVYPLVGLKWTMIMLNEFLPVSMERRRFAGEKPEERKREQLGKAMRQLDSVEKYIDRGGWEWELKE